MAAREVPAVRVQLEDLATVAGVAEQARATRVWLPSGATSHSRAASSVLTAAVDALTVRSAITVGAPISV